MILFLDTNVVIYAVENTSVFGPKANARLTTARAAGDVFMISDLVRMEALVGPLKNKDAALEGHYRLFFSASDVTVVAVTAAVCDRAARVRAAHNFKSIDALQLAAAAEHRADLFLTADVRLASFPDIAVEILR